MDLSDETGLNFRTAGCVLLFQMLMLTTLTCHAAGHGSRYSGFVAVFTFRYFCPNGLASCACFNKSVAFPRVAFKLRVQLCIQLS